MPIPDHRAEDEFGKNVKHQFKMQKNVSKGKVIEVAETLLMRAQNPASMAPYTAAEASMVAADIVNERKVMRIKAHQDPVTSHEIDPVLWSLLHEAPDLQTVIQARPVVRRGRRNNEAMANGAQSQQVQAGGPAVAPANVFGRNVRPRLDVQAELDRLAQGQQELAQGQQELAQGQQEQRTRIEQVNSRAQESVTVSQRTAARAIATLNGRLNRIENGVGGEE